VSQSITLTATATSFKVSATLVPTPAAITLTVALNNGLTGTPVFSVQYGSATLTGTGLTRTLNFSGMATDMVTIRATVTTTDGYAFNDDVSIYKAYDGGTGATGARGAVTRYITSNTLWIVGINDNLVIGNSFPLPMVIGDTAVVKYMGATPNTVTTRYWDGSSWADPGMVLDGNLLVNGSIAGTAIGAGTITASGTGAVAGQTITVNNNAVGITTAIASNIDGRAIVGTTGFSSAPGGAGLVGLSTATPGATTNGAGVYGKGAYGGVFVNTSQYGSAIYADVVAGGVFLWTNQPTQVGSTTVTMPLNDKPGASSGPNKWLKLRIGSSNYFMPVWIE